MRYAIWNNKGGVGKSFLTFVLGSEYAYIHPDTSVLLIDMCPQANLSEIILGGNGKGSEIIREILLKNTNRLTVGGYFDNRILSPHKTTGDETSYLLKGTDYNKELPENLYIICGDPSLEIQAQVINQIGTQTLPVDSWRNVHNWLKDLIISCSNKLSSDANKVTVFIDCNPSFSAYTELSMTASERLIIPCTSDGSSARAVDNVAALLYGFGMSEQHESVNYSTKAKKFNIALPFVHSIILNRSTMWDKKASKAFKAMFDKIKNRVKYHQDKGVFNRDLHFCEVPDTHSVAIVCSHYGKPLYELKPGQYKVHKESPQVNIEPLDRYKENIRTLLKKIT